MINSKVVMNWSSGKDSALAYHFLSNTPGLTVTCLLTTINEANDRIFMHGTRENLLDIQAERMKLPLVKVKYPPSIDHNLYELEIKKALSELKQEGTDTAAYGDIFLEDLRQYREQQLLQVGLKPLFPLWKRDTKQLVTLVEQLGIEAIIVCVNEQFIGKDFLGKKINSDLIQQFPQNVDPCGEYGEFHTFVYNAPFFTSPIQIKTGEVVFKKYSSSDAGQDTSAAGFYFLDVDI